MQLFLKNIIYDISIIVAMSLIKIKLDISNLLSTNKDFLFYYEAKGFEGKDIKDYKINLL